MAGNLITSLLSRATNLLPSITAFAQAPSSSSSNSHNSERERARAIEEDLERLMRTLERIKATLYDAEEREIRDRSVKLWLKELKKVAYDAEDVLSEYQYEVTRVQVETRNTYEATGSHKRKQIEHIVPIPNGTVDRLNKIRNRFDEIAQDREALQLKENDGVTRPNNKILRSPTGPMVDETNIFGRDADITKVTDLLLSEKEKSFSVISIVGRGGLGKTTIAQLVYNDERVSQCFDLNGWVCVSEEFDVRKLIKATIEYFSKTNCGLSELSQLQEELAKIVKGKTILLVLDDVWNENHNLWESFQVPFKEATMVRILMTTRNKKVAKVMQTTTCFNPFILSEYSCWQLFEHYAFSDTSYAKPKHLLHMGREIMRKCGGLPLAVKSIASLLRHEADEEVWRDILESGLWENKESKEVIFPALQISYAHLPAHLKPCFLFFSMYPKDETLIKKDLIELWIAHGYIESRSNRKIREIGAEYYNELKGRSFLDDACAFTISKECCKLHDIIHDLARLNSENEHNSVDINQPLDIQERTVMRETYHLYVRGSMGHVNQIPQQTMKGLRTIFMEIQECNRDFEYGYCTNCTKSINQNLELRENCQDCLGDVTLFNLNKFEVLRVLILESDSLTKIPHSISELKHLTYLSIHSFRLKMLPLSIGLLYNLLAFNVFCRSLEYLPENIGDLASLQFLTISSYRLKMLPKSLCSLTNLLELAIDGDFLDCDPHGLVNFPSIATVRVYWQVRTIGWLKDTKDLKGKISIVSLNNISNLEDVKRANLRNKCKLEILELRWDHNFFHASDSEDSKLILDLIPKSWEDQILGEDEEHLPLIECLQPHPNLKVLRVGGYSSPIVPEWMRDPFSLQSIQELWLESCGYIESLPFGNLHTLKYLHITECFSIRTMKLEQLPSRLETLIISMCDHLELITGLRHLDMLETLEISFCKTLKSLTMDGLELVESTELFGDFSHEIPHINQQSISSLRRLVIENCGSLHSLPDGLIPPGPFDVCVQGCGCSDYYKSNQDVLFVGSGNSGMEIAFDLFEAGPRTSVVMRSTINSRGGFHCTEIFLLPNAPKISTIRFPSKFVQIKRIIQRKKICLALESPVLPLSHNDQSLFPKKKPSTLPLVIALSSLASQISSLISPSLLSPLLHRHSLFLYHRRSVLLHSNASSTSRRHTFNPKSSHSIQIHIVTKEIWLFGMRLMKYLPMSIVDQIILFLCYLRFGNTAKYGLMRPDFGPLYMLMLSNTHLLPVVDVGTYDRIKTREIQVLPSLTSIEGKMVTFSNGKTHHLDAIEASVVPQKMLSS